MRDLETIVRVNRLAAEAMEKQRAMRTLEEEGLTLELARKVADHVALARQIVQMAANYQPPSPGEEAAQLRLFGDFMYLP